VASLSSDRSTVHKLAEDLQFHLLTKELEEEVIDKQLQDYITTIAQLKQQRENAIEDYKTKIMQEYVEIQIQLSEQFETNKQAIVELYLKKEKLLKEHYNELKQELQKHIKELHNRLKAAQDSERTATVKASKLREESEELSNQYNVEKEKNRLAFHEHQREKDTADRIQKKIKRTTS